MRRLSWLLILLGAAVLTGPVMAQEIIYFTNGTTMPVNAHEVDGDMIVVTLEGSATMAFPAEQVEKVENASGRVLIGGTLKNKMVGPSTTSAPVTGVRPSRYTRGKWDAGQKSDDLGVRSDSFGVATMPMQAGRPNGIRVTGRTTALSGPISRTNEGGQAIGGKRFGTGYKIPARGTAGSQGGRTRTRMGN